MSRFLFLGTGAADIDFYVMPEESFENKSFRRCSCGIINGKVMFDCGPFAVNSLNTAQIPLSFVTDIVFTHMHQDHFCQKTVEAIALSREAPLNIWVRFDSVLPELKNCIVHRMNLFTEYEVGGIKITGIPANHSMWPQHIYAETSDNKKILYATDGAWMLKESVDFLRNKYLDTIMLDCTVGDYLGDYRMGEHNSIPLIRVMIPSMRTNGILKDDSKIILTHLAMSLNDSYEETVEDVKKDGYTVAYDGFETEI